MSRLKLLTRIITLGLPHLLTETNTKTFPGFKWPSTGEEGRQTYRRVRADCIENVGSLDVSQSYGTPRPITGDRLTPRPLNQKYVFITDVNGNLQSVSLRKRPQLKYASGC
jgi:hypothetical protein